MAVGHLQVENAFSTRSLRSEQLAVGGQTLTCAIRRSGISGLGLFITTSASLGCWGSGGGGSGSVASSLGAGGSGAGVAESGSGSFNPKADVVLMRQNQLYSQTSRKEQKIHYEQGVALTARISSCRISSVSAPVVL
jgi:hypothetical protein